MKSFRKDTWEERELPAFLTSLLHRLNIRVIAAADLLQRKTNKYSAGQKKLVLALFVLVFATISIVVVIHTIKQNHHTTVAVSRIKTVTVETSKPDNASITKREISRIQEFRAYIDSLATTAKGKKLRDSLLHTRPYLMDSIDALLKFYFKQSKQR